MAIDGTECTNLLEVLIYNEDFWNSAINLEPETPMKTIMTHYFRLADEKLSEVGMDLATWLGFYEAFKAATDSQLLSSKFTDYYGHVLLNARVITIENRDKKVYMETKKELLATIKELHPTNNEKPTK